MKSLTLIAAIAAVIADKTSSQSSFSAHDVSLELRRQVNTGELEVTDLTRETVDGIPNTYRIDHNKVREYVAQSFSNQMAGYERDFTRGYTLYRPQSQGSRTYIPGNGLGRGGRPVPAPVAAAPTLVPAASFVPSLTRVGKIRTYLSRKLTNGQTPTLKQIQSRLKGDDVTCAQLADIVKADGYRLEPNPSCPSRSKVTA